MGSFLRRNAAVVEEGLAPMSVRRRSGSRSKLSELAQSNLEVSICDGNIVYLELEVENRPKLFATDSLI